MKHPSANRLTAALPYLVTGLIVGIYGLTVWRFTEQLGTGMRQQLLSRDSEALYAVAQMDLQSPDSDLHLLGTLEDPYIQEEVALRTSRLRSVMAYRLFTPEGNQLSAFPPEASDGSITPEVRQRLADLRPVSHFEPEADLADIFLTEPRGRDTVPILTINIPFHQGSEDRLLGIAQFILDGRSLAIEYESLSRSLRHQAMVTFLTGSLIIAAGLGWAFSRLSRANRRLRKNREELIRTNRELADAARTSAVGAISAHLVHGLINPLSGLQGFIADRAAKLQADDEDWEEAAHAARRMQTMVQEVVRVIRDDADLSDERIEVVDLAALLRHRLQETTDLAGVELRLNVTGAGSLSNRTANLAILILTNLLTNAIQATPEGKPVSLDLVVRASQLTAIIEDSGAGIPDSIREELFQPRRSSKPGGNGIGLAISKHLANHLEAQLELAKTGPSGSTFKLVLPAELLEKPDDSKQRGDIEAQRVVISHGSVSPQS